MEKMTDSQWRAFASEGTRTGKAGVTRKDGTPHVTPIWFVLDGDDLLFTTHGQSIKGRVLSRDPRLCVCVDDQTPPYSYVMLYAEASLIEDVAEVRNWATVIGARYMGAGRAEEYGERNGVPGEYLVRARVTKVIAERAIAT
ncbi:PPOX class F420-dependent oxidoreductase [Actinomadura macra]|uniref:PPOX class F420-dependent oxidoreductase n=1 Tax=Actinomadura macra TaxID=46164 RepID=UPI000830C7B6|nr:PPOX class F420-dependent oxidoreductase [Actinomadura macra]